MSARVFRRAAAQHSSPGLRCIRGLLSAKEQTGRAQIKGKVHMYMVSTLTLHAETRSRVSTLHFCTRKAKELLRIKVGGSCARARAKGSQSTPYVSHQVGRL